MIKNFEKRLRLKLNLFPKYIFFKDLKFVDTDKSSLLKEIYLTGYYEFEVIKFFDYFNYETFIDVGSNIGFFSLYLKKYKKWDVLAFEPYLKNFNFALKLMHLNKIKYNIINKAVSSSSGKETLFIPSNKKFSVFSGCASLMKPGKIMEKMYGKQQYKKVKVRTISINEIINKYDNKHVLVKLDTEGHELNILNSLRNLKKINTVDFIVEMNINDKSCNKIFKIFKDTGFNAYLMSNLGLVFEDRPLTLPKYDILVDNKDYGHRPCWRNHFFTKKNKDIIKKKNLKIFGYDI